eukprot:TRINITY_DN3394_c0_g6_i1.p1 TRINITY_DN3394_c0_g6~~TRINITY_DN3394_c0_g6_i1.p1  ORF type:complete len:642 (+),score=204.13 TRINITY_DN3394_c0_g6_i1:180-2105(+)
METALVSPDSSSKPPLVKVAKEGSSIKIRIPKTFINAHPSLTTPTSTSSSSLVVDSSTKTSSTTIKLPASSIRFVSKAVKKEVDDTTLPTTTERKRRRQSSTSSTTKKNTTHFDDDVDDTEDEEEDDDYVDRTKTIAPTTITTTTTTTTALSQQSSTPPTAAHSSHHHKKHKEKKEKHKDKKHKDKDKDRDKDKKKEKKKRQKLLSDESSNKTSTQASPSIASSSSSKAEEAPKIKLKIVMSSSGSQFVTRPKEELAQKNDAGDDAASSEEGSLQRARRKSKLDLQSLEENDDEIVDDIIYSLKQISSKDTIDHFMKFNKNKDLKCLGVAVPMLMKTFKSKIEPVLEKRRNFNEKLELANRLFNQELEETITLATCILEKCVHDWPPPTHDDNCAFNYLDKCLDRFHSWGSVDSFCCGFMQDLIVKYPKETMELLSKWNSSPNVWKRRASVVVFCRKLAKTGRFVDEALSLCANLVEDKEELVLKAVGWCLKDNMHNEGPKEKVMNFISQLRTSGASPLLITSALKKPKTKEKPAAEHKKASSSPPPTSSSTASQAVASTSPIAAPAVTAAPTPVAPATPTPPTIGSIAASATTASTRTPQSQLRSSGNNKKGNKWQRLRAWSGHANAAMNKPKNKLKGTL